MRAAGSPPLLFFRDVLYYRHIAKGKDMGRR